MTNDSLIRLNVLKVFNEYGYSKVSKEDLRKQLFYYKNLGKDLRTLYYIARRLLKYGINEKLSYEKTLYFGMHKKITITCKEHGDFEQDPSSHTHGAGCRKCNILIHNKADFVREARRIHGNRYDYSKFVIAGRSNKSTIICPIHGEFQQNYGNHLMGKGCSKCTYETIKSKLIISKEQFIERAKAVHGNRYDYSKVEYNGAFKKVAIVCPVHGEFRQTPHSHTSSMGSGCPKCSESSMERAFRVKLESFKLTDGVHYESQKTFPNLVGPETGKSLFYDFYFIRDNFVIELDGKQHFEPYYGLTQEKFKRRLKYDKIKDEYAKKAGIKLKRVSYLEFRKWIKTISSFDDLIKFALS